MARPFAKSDLVELLAGAPRSVFVDAKRLCATCRQRDELTAEVSRLRKLFDDAGQGEHNVLALVDHYQHESIEAADRLRATCRQRDELVEVVRELVEALDMAAHSAECSRTEECDDERGHDCGYHERACPSCECGVDRWQVSAAKARAVLAKWGAP